MKRGLRSLRILPRGPAGWSLPEQTFGETTTLVSGPLGSGKTPVLKALAFTLGAATELPPAIKEHCSWTCLTLWVDGEIHELRRKIETGVVALGTGPDGKSLEIFDEKNLGQWILQRLGVPERDFVNKQGARAFSYMSLLAPVFIVDQDVGWTAPYVPSDAYNFVRDQREEILRWILDVPAKHRAIDKSAFEQAKLERGVLQEQINFKRHTIERLAKEEHPTPDALENLVFRRVELHEQFRSASALLESFYRSESVLDVRIRESVGRRDAAQKKLSTFARRRAQIVDAQEDVHTEVEALEQNEIAASAFRAICGSKNCGFFRQPEESYGRRLLYLKDQLKDFALANGQIAEEMDRLEAEAEAAELDAEFLLGQKKQSLVSAGAAETIAAVESLTRELSELSVAIDRARRLGIERVQLDALVNKELRAGEIVAELRPSGGRRDNARLLDARAHLAKSFNEWVVALKTPNILGDSSVDEELRVIVSGERFGAKISYSGSTRTRLVLAYHGAVVETALRMNGSHPPVLVLDAPRQHELAPEDIRLFVERFETLRTLSSSARLQLVLSSTDQSVAAPGSEAVVWLPSFSVADGRRYFGPVAPADDRSA